MTITFTLTYDKVRKVLSSLTGRRQEDILASNKLVDDFGFTEAGFARLLGGLQNEFDLYNVDLTQENVTDSETVNDLVLTIWSKIPNDQKETTPFTDALLSQRELLEAFSHEISKTSEAKRKERALRKKKV